MSESGPGGPDSDNEAGENNICEWCGDSLSTPSGLRRHKRLKHESKLEHACPTCGRKFTSEHGVKTHHKRSHGKSLSYVSETCVYCGKEFQYKWHTRPNAKYCDQNCRDNHQIREHHPNWKGGKITIECDWCGDLFKVNPNQEHRRFCDKWCMAEWQTGQMCGSDNPVWAGGKVRYYGPNWTRQRAKALDRDQHRCQRCGVTSAKLGQEPDVHHRKRIKWFKEQYDAPEWYEKGNRLDNLITLCRECHGIWEQIPLKLDLRHVE